MTEEIEVYGARVHNLKNVDITIPRNQLVVLTGLSGSGKSSLAFDTIYAEGQRRYIETFSSYARQFLGNLERPDVDEIRGLSPVISIEQKTVSKNPRSTVGTITEIYDFIRLLYAKTAEAYSYKTGKKMIRYSEDQIIALLLNEYANKNLIILAPLIKARKGHYRELFEQLGKQGFTKVLVDGEILDIKKGMKLDRYKVHDIAVVIDRIKVDPNKKTRLQNAVETALKKGSGEIIVKEHKSTNIRVLSQNLMDPETGIAYPEPEPNLFSFNSPYGACKRCNGLGEVSVIDIKKIIPNPEKSIKQGGIAPLGKYKKNHTFRVIEGLINHYGFKLTQPLKEIPEEMLTMIINGTEEVFTVKTNSGKTYKSSGYEGIADFIVRHFEETPSRKIKRWAEGFMNKEVCPKCHGTRINTIAQHFKLNNTGIHELANIDIRQLKEWFSNIEFQLTERQLKIGREILKEIKTRIGFLLDVGLDYLTLNRSARSLSGGEAQRIRLATQIGTELTNVLYILDEPSIGLHQRDNSRLIKALKKLRDAGNSIIVVEHDKEMIESADRVIDIGPGAGEHGGEILSNHPPKQLKKVHSLTADYLNNKKSIAVPPSRRKGNKKSILLKKASGHNLKNVNLKLPLGTFICVTGVSGSGKSSLVNQTLYPILSKYFYKSVKKPLPYDKIEGLKNLDKVIEIDQSPIGRTPRSNPATYTGVFSNIRNLFSDLPEAKIRGYKPGRFSFNVKGGRCETCKGAGLRTIEMNFLPDVFVECEDCMGKRYNRETLEVRYKGKSISDVLNLTIEHAVDFFEHIPAIHRKLLTLKSVGLGYVRLGQPSTTLSGGEAQRVKLATELAKKSTGKTLYILDEPTTGLHFEDIRMLLNVLNSLVDQGNTVLVIEHNLDIIKSADHIIDLGPEGGKGGGQILVEGTPEQIIKSKKSITARYLAEEL